ncbi:unnamed protein product [marine sediment metagenome]|uniref:Uncharacterized protein n=1 Tax=marine sediment metagenome TaxID=412755 RepID=X1BSX6_9ZZZZ
MKTIFFIKSSTVNLENYYIKDIQGTSGRLDVVSRCVLSAITSDNKLEKDIQIWAFLDKYGTFVFDSNTFNNDTFPKNEILLTDYFVDFIKKGNKKYTVNPLDSIKSSNLDIFEAIKKLSGIEEHTNDKRSNQRRIIGNVIDLPVEFLIKHKFSPTKDVLLVTALALLLGTILPHLEH